jgi:DNA-binding Lrp family transcriptional regulator
MEIILDKIDKKLISYLYHHYREPLTKIAKACKISRDQVEYRMKKYESQGLIKKYATIFNYRALGYDEFVIVWMKLRSANEKALLRKELEDSKSAITVFDVVGKYDLGADFVLRNKDEFQKTLGDILKKYDVVNHSVFMTTKFEFFTLKEFEIFQQENMNYSAFSNNSTKKTVLDEKEIKIIKSLERNGRVKLIDIAKETNISSELILYKIKKMHENKIILGSRIVFDHEKFGYFFGSIRLKLKNIDEETIKKISKYCRYHRHINALSFGIGENNCLVQVFYKEEKIFRSTIKDFLYKFRDNIQTSDILLIENEGRIKTLPN